MKDDFGPNYSMEDVPGSKEWRMAKLKAENERLRDLVESAYFEGYYDCELNSTGSKYGNYWPDSYTYKALKSEEDK